ncbi:MAG: ABC transporter ATP-binding protein [Pirellulales bacterium]|nr:ABC transporter ATP-binding protein [Pirellulales bacterium]
MIELHNVVRTYGRKVAVDGLTMTVPEGELFAFLGPNGAGKTTTIKMMVGLLRPDSGTVRIAGLDVVTHARQAAAVLGYVPEEPYLYEKLTGREFLEFTARVRGFDRRETDRRIAAQVEQFRLESFLDTLTETYSHGMKQRLAFAAALLHDPAVLVVDEPTVGLDPASVRLLKDHFRKRVAAGMAIFMSTHTLAVAEEIADRIGIVDHGRLIFLGTRDEVRRQYESGESSLEPFFLRLTSNGNGQAAPPKVEPSESPASAQE